MRAERPRVDDSRIADYALRFTGPTPSLGTPAQRDYPLLADLMASRTRLMAVI
ncbi:MAG: hypothetical protein IPP17_30815 [Bacteroidetes bacterium]|nr:hypothetical protein [Bacteroidota bacterium]